MSIKGSISLFFTLLFSNLIFAQNVKRIYFIEKLSLSDLIKKSYPDHERPQIMSAAVELYSYQNGIKQDSLTLHAENFLVWKDSVAFRVDIPANFLSNQKISLVPIYHFNKNGNKGSLPSYVAGNEQPITPFPLKIKSNPSGAKVYLIPKLYWERNPDFAKFKSGVLFPYQVSEGNTTVTTYVQEYVYMAVFKYQNRFVITPCSPNHLHVRDSLFVDFKH